MIPGHEWQRKSPSKCNENPQSSARMLGSNEFLARVCPRPGLLRPREAAAGGAETMYPEYMKTVGQLTIQSCQRYCTCTGWIAP